MACGHWSPRPVGPRADVEELRQGDLGDSKPSLDFGDITRTELRQRAEFNFACGQRSLDTMVRDGVLESSAEPSKRCDSALLHGAALCRRVIVSRRAVRAYDAKRLSRHRGARD